MQLTTQTDYALRTLMYLAAVSSRATVGEVSQLFGISVHHVAKVVNLLSRHGFVRSIRGVGGGIELARQPDQILVGDVISRFEGSLHLLDCIDQTNVCAIESFCKLKRVLAEAERIQLEYLNSVTLAEIAPTHRQLNRSAASSEPK
ncbi:MAG: Rrf2 family transcriptional regulator [Planctomycetaceae bacterium]